MTSLLQISINFTALNSSGDSFRTWSFGRFRSFEPIKFLAISGAKSEWLCKKRFKKGVSRESFSFLGMNWDKDGILIREKRRKRIILARFNEGFGFNGLGAGGSGGGGGGGKDNGPNSRVLGNLALAIGLTYLSMTGQLGWFLDAIVSVWLLAVLLPIVGLGAFLFWASRDIIQDSCPNCGKDFQILKSTINEELQLCPFCTQPFSVVGNEFVRDPVKFSNQSSAFGEAFSEFSSQSKKGKESSMAVVDVEAEVKDID